MYNPMVWCNKAMSMILLQSTFVPIAADLKEYGRLFEANSPIME